MSEDTKTLLAPYAGRHDLVEAFRKAPLGPWPDELLHLLTVLRGVPAAGKYVLVECEDPQGGWALATLPGTRGEAPTPVPGYRFTSLAEAEWTVFRLRWAYWTGEELPA
jgi:hypothetical protein